MIYTTVRYNDLQEHYHYDDTLFKNYSELTELKCYFKVERDSFGFTIELNYITCLLKLKPLPDDMSDGIKYRINALFNEHVRLYKQ